MAIPSAAEIVESFQGAITSMSAPLSIPATNKRPISSLFSIIDFIYRLCSYTNRLSKAWSKLNHLHSVSQRTNLSNFKNIINMRFLSITGFMAASAYFLAVTAAPVSPVQGPIPPFPYTLAQY
jgi:hypothetical protein